MLGRSRGAEAPPLHRIRVSEGTLQNEQFTRLMEGIGSANLSERVMALYGLEGYTAVHPETRTQILHVLAAHIRILDRVLDRQGDQDRLDELRIAAGISLNVSRFENAENNLLSFDLSDVDLRSTPMPGLRSEAGYFINTVFSREDLTGSTWICSDLSGANFSGATLDGAQFRGVDLTGANFRDASLVNVEFNDVHWEKGKGPSWPAGFALHVVDRGGGDFEQRKCKEEHELVKGP